jgi:hypothetical protein
VFRVYNVTVATPNDFLFYSYRIQPGQRLATDISKWTEEELTSLLECLEGRCFVEVDGDTLSVTLDVEEKDERQPVQRQIRSL